MSSVQSFMRQRVVGTRTASVPTTFASGSVFQFRPAPGNYVGTYPPGYMLDVATELNGLLANYSSGKVLRDMGKTIKAVINTTLPVDLSTGAGFFREYQVLVPGVASLNGVAGATSGVIGGPPAGGNVVPYYYTVYVPVVVNGMLAVGASLPPVALTIDGQM